MNVLSEEDTPGDVQVNKRETDQKQVQTLTHQNLDRALQNAFSTINVFILILIMIAMGAKMKLKHIRNHVKKPLGPLAGFVSQFVIMPLVAFLVAHLLKLEAEHSIGAIIMACSPGGVMSNMVTYYTNGDCSLSITMTTLSTLMAFGMMPSNLWLYTRTWTKGTTVSIPYKGILVSLLLILIPVAAGYLFVLKYPNMRSVVAKTGSFSGMLAIVISMILFFFMNYNLMQMLSIDICIATATMPILGFCFGYALSALFCLTQKQKRTVGFETGCQNASIAFSVISMSFPADVLSHFLLVPLLFCLFSFIEGWLFVVTWQAVKTLRGKCEVWKEDGCVGFEESSDEEDGHSKREPDEKLKATVASITQSAIEWKLRRQHSSSSKNASRNNSAANLHPQSSQQQSRPHQPHPHNSLNSQQQQYQSSYNSSSQQQTTTAAQMAMQNIRSPTPTRINMATASVGNGGGMFLVDHTKSTQV